MARAVVILGAGSSVDFGVPPLSNIFKDPSARKYLRQQPELLTMLNKVFWKPRRHDLESSEQTLNIEQMLTILKDWENEQHLPDRDKPTNAENFRRRLKVLIYKAVFEDKTSNSRHLNPLIEIFKLGRN